MNTSASLTLPDYSDRSCLKSSKALSKEAEVAKVTSSSRRRTRTGCLICRKKHVKCDEARPACKRCSRLKLGCTYGVQLTWADEARSKGKCHGRSGVWSKHPKAPPSSLGQARAAGQKVLLESIRDETKYEEDETLSVSSQTQHFRDRVFLNTSVGDIEFHVHNSTIGYHQRSGQESEDKEESTGTLCISQIRRAQFDPISRQLETGSPELPLPIFQSTKPGKYGHLARILLYHFEEVLCPVATIVDDMYSNPARNAALAMAFRSPIANLAVLMTTAHYLRHVNPTYLLVELEFRKFLLEELRNAFKTGRWDWDEVMISAVMLCSSEISEGCGSEWVAQFTCYRDVILRRMTQSQYTHRDSSVFSFFCQYFAYHLVTSKTVFSVEDTMSSITSIQPQAISDTPKMLITNEPNTHSPDSANLSWTSTESISVSMTSDTLDHIDTWTCFSNTLLLLINEIAHLKHDIYLLSTDPDFRRQEESTLRSKTYRIRDRLQTLQQTVSPHAKATDTQKHNLLYHAEARRLAALLYLHESTTPSFIGSSLSSTSPLITPMMDAQEKSDCIKAILAIVDEIVTTTELSVAWPLWPLFLAGCSTDDEHDKLAVMRIFKIARQKVKFANIAPAQRVVELVWQQRDFRPDITVVSPKEPLPRMPCYEWEIVIAKMGWTLSLA